MDKSEVPRVGAGHVVWRTNRCPHPRCQEKFASHAAFVAHLREGCPPPTGTGTVVTYRLDTKGRPKDVRHTGFSSDDDALAFVHEVERAARRSSSTASEPTPPAGPGSTAASVIRQTRSRSTRRRPVSARRRKARAPDDDDLDPPPQPRLTLELREKIRQARSDAARARLRGVRECPSCDAELARDAFRRGRAVCRQCEALGAGERRLSGKVAV